MEEVLRVLGIAGSLRKGSYNRAALRAVQQLAPPDLTIEIFDLEGIPPFNDDLVARPEVLIPMAREKFDVELTLTDERTQQQIAKQLAALAAWTRRLRKGLAD